MFGLGLIAPLKTKIKVLEKIISDNAGKVKLMGEAHRSSMAIKEAELIIVSSRLAALQLECDFLVEIIDNREQKIIKMANKG